jgi:hypothetical protein
MILQPVELYTIVSGWTMSSTVYYNRVPSFWSNLMCFVLADLLSEQHPLGATGHQPIPHADPEALFHPIRRHASLRLHLLAGEAAKWSMVQ